VLGIAIWNNNDFPLIDDNGNELTSEKDPGWVDVKGDIVSAGISTYPGIFMVSWNGLGQTEQSQIVINAGANGAIEGWQSNMHIGLTRQAGCDSKRGHGLRYVHRFTLSEHPRQRNRERRPIPRDMANRFVRISRCSRRGAIETVTPERDSDRALWMD
jgi:hypothetical protein